MTYRCEGCDVCNVFLRRRALLYIQVVSWFSVYQGVMLSALRSLKSRSVRCGVTVEKEMVGIAIEVDRVLAVE